MLLELESFKFMFKFRLKGRARNFEPGLRAWGLGVNSTILHS